MNIVVDLPLLPTTSAIFYELFQPYGAYGSSTLINKLTAHLICPPPHTVTIIHTALTSTNGNQLYNIAFTGMIYTTIVEDTRRGDTSRSTWRYEIQHNIWPGWLGYLLFLDWWTQQHVFDIFTETIYTVPRGWEPLILVWQTGGASFCI